MNNIKYLRQNIRLALYMAKTDLKSEVANSYLNWIWWVLQPLMEMVIYAIVFGSVFGSTEKAYPVFIYSGLIMWGFFTRSISSSVQIVRANRDIVTKVYVPKYVFILANMFGNLFKLFVGFLVMIPILIIYKISISWITFQLLVVLLVYFIFTFSLAMILLHFGVFVDDLSYAISILLNALMFLSGVFYNIDTALPEGIASIFNKFNPIAIILKQMRIVLINGGVIDGLVLTIWGAISLVLSIVGLVLVYKYENSYVKVI